jgi:hypothetical protein
MQFQCGPLTLKSDFTFCHHPLTSWDYLTTPDSLHVTLPIPMTKDQTEPSTSYLSFSSFTFFLSLLFLPPISTYSFLPFFKFSFEIYVEENNLKTQKIPLSKYFQK